MESSLSCIQSGLFKFAAVVGAYYTIKGTYNLYSFVKKNFFSSKQDLVKKYGYGWVVISGASDGIGLSFADRFLEQGFKVCLIARNCDKLQTVVSELLKKYPTSTIHTITYNFDNEYQVSDISVLQDEIDKLEGDISVLINNVGYVSRGLFAENKDEEIHSMIRVNIDAMIFLTKICVDKMKGRERSLIVGSGATMGRLRFPTRTVYGSCKYFMESFLECLGKEYPNIDCTCLDLGPVFSNFNPVKMPFSITPDELTEQAMKRIGKYELTTGHLQHDLFRVIFTYVPFTLGMFHKKIINSIKKEN